MEIIKTFRILTILILPMIMLWMCSNRPVVQNSQIETAERFMLPAAAQNDYAIPEYRLGFGDVINIKFFRNSQFDETVTVRPDGRISMAKVGELQVTGMTPSQLDSVITKSYAEFVLEPDVTVIVREFGGYQIYVLGEVNSPGGYPVQRSMTLLQALAAAGGYKTSAKLGSVIVIRQAQNQKIKTIKVNLSKSLKAKRGIDVIQNDIIVQPQDIVFVPKTFIANVSDFMRQVYAGFLPPLDLYLRAVLFYDR